MRVALITNHQKYTGVGRYAFTLFLNLLKVKKSNDLIELFEINRNKRTLFEIADASRHKKVVKQTRKNPIFDNPIFRRYGLSNLFFDYRSAKDVPRDYDIYHITNQVISNLSYYDNFKNNILTVHDLDYYTHPSSSFQKKLSVLVYNGLKNSEKIISISNYTKNIIIKYFGIPDCKVRVIYHGVEEQFKPLKERDLEELREKFRLNGDFYYILHVGVDVYRKNLITLLKAVKILISDYKFKKVKLIKVNKLSEATISVIRNLNLQHHIITIDYVPEKDLIKLYNIADIFIFPSIQEGFGFPVLEAMACGTPVIASNSASIPEIVGNAGILLNPYDASGFAEAMYTVLSDESLKRKMGKKGLRRARKFSWEKCAREHLKVYEEVVNQ